MDMEQIGNASILTAAVVKKITCELTGEVLDVRRAVFIDVPGSGMAVMSADGWDRIKDEILAKRDTIEVIDGRELPAEDFELVID